MGHLFQSVVIHLGERENKQEVLRGQSRVT